MTARTAVLAAATSVIASVALAACDSASGPPASSTSGPTSAATPSTPTTSPSPSATPATDLADGRHPARIVRVDAARRLVTVDVVQFLTGSAAASAAAADGAEEVPPPNDYWIRNVNPRLRTLPVDESAPITTNVLTADQSGSATADVAVDLGRLGQLRGLSRALFWLTVRDGVVTAVSEQFLP